MKANHPTCICKQDGANLVSPLGYIVCEEAQPTRVMEEVYQDRLYQCTCIDITLDGSR